MQSTDINACYNAVENKRENACNPTSFLKN